MPATALAPRSPRTSHQIAFRYRSTDGLFGITRQTTQRLASHLGVDETQAIHMALVNFAATHLPQYERDEGALTVAQYDEIDRLAAPALAKIRKIQPTETRSVRSSLFGITGWAQAGLSRRRAILFGVFTRHLSLNFAQL